MRVRWHVLDCGTPTGTRSPGRLSCAKRTPGSSTRARIAICFRRAVAVGASSIIVSIRQPAGGSTPGAQRASRGLGVEDAAFAARQPPADRPASFPGRATGGSMRVEDDSIVALEPRSNEALMRELARAIRRFSTERAREAWCECAMGLDRLEREFSLRPATTADRWCCACDARAWAPVLRSALREPMPPGPSGRRGARAATRGQMRGWGVDARRAASRVENFRLHRTEGGLPHYDLDCYVAGRQVIFTWRPLPE